MSGRAKSRTAALDPSSFGSPITAFVPLSASFAASKASPEGAKTTTLAQVAVLRILAIVLRSSCWRSGATAERRSISSSFTSEISDLRVRRGREVEGVAWATRVFWGSWESLRTCSGGLRDLRCGRRVK